jgi:hypothetical protein
MNTAQPIKALAVAKHMQALLQTTVSVKELPAADMKPPLVFAKVHDSAGKLVCVMVADIACAGSTGAALSRIPAGAVTDLLRKDKPLDEDLLANFHEVANVLTVLTTAALGQRTTLGTVDQATKELATDVNAFMASAGSKLAFQASVQGYPPGTLTFYQL